MIKGNQLVASPHLQQDGGAVFELGKRLALEKGIPDYKGVIVGKGRSHLPLFPGTRRIHCFSWTGDSTSEVIVSVHSKNVQWTGHTVSPKQLKDHHFIAILESHPTGRLAR